MKIEDGRRKLKETSPCSRNTAGCFCGQICKYSVGSHRAIQQDDVRQKPTTADYLPASKHFLAESEHLFCFYFLSLSASNVNQHSFRAEKMISISTCPLSKGSKVQNQTPASLYSGQSHISAACRRIHSRVRALKFPSSVGCLGFIFCHTVQMFYQHP